MYLVSKSTEHNYHFLDFTAFARKNTMGEKPPFCSPPGGVALGGVFIQESLISEP